MSKWPMVKLGDVCDIQSGGTPLRANRKFWDDGTIPWVKISDISGKYLYETQECITDLGLASSSARIFKSGTILYTIFATLGDVCILNKDASTNQAIAGLRLKDASVYTDYLYYYLLSLKEQVKARGRGVAQNNINLSILRSFQIPLPPLGTQKQIAAELDKITSLIEKRKSQLAKLDLLIKSKFIEMFGDPVTNPMGWDVHLFSEVASSRLGKMLDKKKQVGVEKSLYLANYNVQWFRFALDDVKKMEFSTKEKCKFSLKKGDLLVCEGGVVGRCCVWNNEIEYCYFQKALHRVRCNDSVLDSTYLAWLLYFKSNYNEFRDIVGSHSTIAHLTGEKLKIIPVMLPTIQKQKSFADFVLKTEKIKSTMEENLLQLEILYKERMLYYFN